MLSSERNRDQTKSNPLEPEQPTDRFNMVALILSFGSGATDAFAFLLLGGIFTANMTGNLILVGLPGRPDYLHTVIGALLAIAAFSSSAFASFKITRASLPPAVSRRGMYGLLLGSAGIQLLVMVAWIQRGRESPLWLQTIIIALTAAVMGAQTAVSKRVQKRSGITTTFVSGTLTSLMQDLAEGNHGVHLIRFTVILALIAGALSCGLLIDLAPNLGALIPAAASLIAVLLVGSGRRKRSP